MPPRSLLILWDVDFTLVDAGGLGRELYRLAFLATFGSEPPESSWPTMAGRTDRAIVTEMLRLAGVPGPRRRAGEFIAAMVRAAPGLAGLARERVRALPGAAAAVAASAGLPGLPGLPGPAGPSDSGKPVQSLLTGNIRPLAELKMAATGLGRDLDLEAGAYGDAHEDRADLVHLARRPRYRPGRRHSVRHRGGAGHRGPVGCRRNRQLHRPGASRRRGARGAARPARHGRGSRGRARRAVLAGERHHTSASGTSGSVRRGMLTGLPERISSWMSSLTSQTFTFMPATTTSSDSQNAMNSSDSLSPR